MSGLYSLDENVLLVMLKVSLIRVLSDDGTKNDGLEELSFIILVQTVDLPSSSTITIRAAFYIAAEVVSSTADSKSSTESTTCNGSLGLTYVLFLVTAPSVDIS